MIPVPPSSEKDNITLLKNNNSVRKATEEICPKCRRKFEYLSAGIYAKDSGVVQYYPEHCRLCDARCKDEEWYTLMKRSANAYMPRGIGLLILSANFLFRSELF